MTFGERIVYYRKLAGFTQKSLADALEISPTRLNYWEKDKREPDIMMLNRLCAILKVEADTLLGRHECGIPEKAELSAAEKEGIKKYRTLDEHGRRMVDLVLDEEYSRMLQSTRTIHIAARGGGVQEIQVDASALDQLSQLPETDEDI